MEPESLSAEFAFPPAPPLLPPPIPPPVVPPRVGNERTSSLWRWNDRLAWVAGGLALFLLGIATGRIIGPNTASDANAVEPIAAVSTALPPSEASGVVSTESAACEAEVNPPELIFFPEPAEPTAIPEDAQSAIAASTTLTSEPPATASNPQPPGQTATAITSNIETAITESTSPVTKPPQSSPVSLEGKVTTIKPLAVTQVCETAEKYKDRKLSTALTWAESVDEAAQQAEQDEKLVFLIHVSGNFEMPGFT